MDNENFFVKNLGAIIGVIVGAILACTGLYRLMIFVIAVILGGFIGNYVQHNKEGLKEKAKNFIDKL